ncbi:MAG TPA: protease complex subunit PrcB family protein [Opitutaceae bacterium]|nr:protease complex subunit PrcB family protein [Opitutaceae bacterium]
MTLRGWTFLFLSTALGIVRPTSAASDETSPSTPPRAQWHGTQGGMRAFSVRAIRANADWISLWKQIGREAPQAFDEAHDMAVAIFIGERRTGGYGVEIVGTRPGDDRLIVEFRETTPAPDAMVTQALTTPWAVALVPRSTATVVAHPADAPPAQQP